MAASTNDFTVDSADWYDVHAASGAPAGSAGVLYRKCSQGWGAVFMSPTKPAASAGGIPLGPLGHEFGAQSVPADAVNKTWVRAVQGVITCNFAQE